MFEELEPAEIAARFAKNEIVLVDVRTAVEFAFERIHGALNAPMATLDPAKLPNQIDKPLILHCGTGMRSNKVAQACLGAGFGKIAHMKGGLAAWKKAGLPTAAVNPISGNMSV